MQFVIGGTGDWVTLTLVASRFRNIAMWSSSLAHLNRAPRWLRTFAEDGPVDVKLLRRVCQHGWEEDIGVSLCCRRWIPPRVLKRLKHLKVLDLSGCSASSRHMDYVVGRLPGFMPSLEVCVWVCRVLRVSVRVCMCVVY